MVIEYKENTKKKIDEFVHYIYKVTKSFPKEEIYITTSQLKRAALSVILNYVEGYARFKPGYQLQFLETAFGSLKETEYLVDFSYSEKFIKDNSEYQLLKSKINEISALIWTEIKAMRKTDEK